MVRPQGSRKTRAEIPTDSASSPAQLALNRDRKIRSVAHPGGNAGLFKARCCINKVTPPSEAPPGPADSVREENSGSSKPMKTPLKVTVCDRAAPGITAENRIKMAPIGQTNEY